jgi:2-haloacid dehalogenase
VSPSHQAVVFDIGGVLVDWDPRHLFREVIPDEATREWFLREVCHSEWNRRQDEGRPWAEGIAEAVGRHPAHEAWIRAYDERWIETVRGVDDDVVVVVRELRAGGLPVYALTNFSTDKWALSLEQFDVLAEFDGVVVSGEERVTKPQERIYRILLERYQLTPERTFFTDDADANVAGARAVGIDAELFTGAASLRSQLVSRSLLAGTSDGGRIAPVDDRSGV